MRRRLIALLTFLLIAGVAQAQNGGPPIGSSSIGSGGGGATQQSSGAPTGSCTALQTDVDNTTGHFYTCNGGSWFLIDPATTLPTLPTSPNGIAQFPTSTPSGGVGGAVAWSVPGVPVDAQTGTTYTVPITDDVHFLTLNNSSPVAVTGLALANNYVFSGENLGAGLATYTPASGTVNGAASQIIPKNWMFFHYTDNSNTFMPVMPTLAAFSDCNGSGKAETFTLATGTFGCNTISGGAGPAFVVPISVAPPSGTTTSAYVQPDNTAGMMLQRNIVQSTSSSSTIACAYPKNITAASMLYITAAWPSSSATASIADTLTSSFTAVGSGQYVQGGQSAESWFALNSGSGADTATITFSAAQGNAVVSCREYQGVVTSSAVDVQASAHGAGTTPSSGSMTTTNANDLLVGDIVPQVVALVTQAGGYNERQQSWISGFGGDFDSDQLVTSTGSYTNSGTLPSYESTGWVAQEVAFKLTAAPAVAPIVLGIQTPDSFSPDYGDFYGNRHFHKFVSDSPTAVTLGVINIGIDQDICIGSGCIYEQYGVMHMPSSIILDQSGSLTGGALTATSSFSLTHLLSSSTAPTIASGFGTSPSIVASNGTEDFTINVGTGGAATSGVLTMPAANAGWICSATDATTNSTTVFITKAVGTSTTSVTLTNYSDAAVASAWAASDVLQVQCKAY